MRNIQVDTAGRQRCARCGGQHFTLKRTMASKVIFNVGALMLAKRAKCQSCGMYNKLGSAEPYVPQQRVPASELFGILGQIIRLLFETKKQTAERAAVKRMIQEAQS